MEILRFWRALKSADSVKYSQFWENAIRKRKKSRTCFPAKKLSPTCKELSWNGKTQVMWKIVAIRNDPPPRGGTPPPPLSQGLVSPPPPPSPLILRSGSGIDPFPLLCLYVKVTKIHTVLFASVWQNNHIAPLTKLQWGTYSAALIDTFQVVNEVDTCFPPPIDYVSRRILHEGVNMVLDPAFLACCDCTDNCQVNCWHHP